MLSNIKVVLNQTFHSGNIGSALRAMKTMGIDQLALVNPITCNHSEIAKLAAGAEDLIEGITYHASLQDALKNSHLVIASSARTRNFNLPLLTPKQTADKIISSVQLDHKIALVFGGETSGLSNHDFQLCHYHVIIPANPDYNVLNLAAAVQIICYEIWQKHLDLEKATSTKLAKSSSENDQELNYPNYEELSHFFIRLENCLKAINFIPKKHPGNTMVRLKRLFKKAQLEKLELRILEGIITRINQLIDLKK